MKFMAALVFGQPDAEMQSLIPAEQSRVKELAAQGILEVGYISGEKAKVWLVMTSDSKEAVEQAIASLPLHKYIAEVEITPIDYLPRRG